MVARPPAITRPRMPWPACPAGEFEHAGDGDGWGGDQECEPGGVLFGQSGAHGGVGPPYGGEQGEDLGGADGQSPGVRLGEAAVEHDRGGLVGAVAGGPPRSSPPRAPARSGPETRPAPAAQPSATGSRRGGPEDVHCGAGEVPGALTGLSQPGTGPVQTRAGYRVSASVPFEDHAVDRHPNTS